MKRKRGVGSKLCILICRVHQHWIWKRVKEEEMARAGGITNAVNVGIAVQADWENREFISHISLNVRRLFDFLVQFGTHAFPFPTLQNDPSRCRFIYP